MTIARLLASGCLLVSAWTGVVPAQTSVHGIQPPAWAMPLVTAPAVSFDSVVMRRVPGSRVTFTDRRIHDRSNPPDWFPESHPSAPPSVTTGRRGHVAACAYCHLHDGSGRPENQALAGLPASYIVAQVLAMRSGARGSAWPVKPKPADQMRAVADSVGDAELADAARYFASVPPRGRSTVVETLRMPRIVPGNGLWLLDPAGGTEPLGQRLIEVPSSTERHELRDPGVRYVAYVPRGSIARGRRLAANGVAGPATACVTCHGPRLRGVGMVPPIAGRSPLALLRQLVGFAAGARADSASAAMRGVASQLTMEQMIAVAAYAGSRRP